MLTPLKAGFDDATQQKQFYIEVLQSSTPAQLAFKPGPDQWCILQVVHHLVSLEKLSIDFITRFDFNRKNQKLGFKSKLKSWLLNRSLRSAKRFKAPVLAKEAQAETLNANALVQEWAQIRQRLEHFLENYPQEKLQHFIFMHPVAGKLNIVQALKFMKNHMHHHVHQVERIQAYANYPKAKSLAQ